MTVLGALRHPLQFNHRLSWMHWPFRQPNTNVMRQAVTPVRDRRGNICPDRVMAPLPPRRGGPHDTPFTLIQHESSRSIRTSRWRLRRGPQKGAHECRRPRSAISGFRITLYDSPRRPRQAWGWHAAGRDCEFNTVQAARAPAQCRGAAVLPRPAPTQPLRADVSSPLVASRPINITRYSRNILPARDHPVPETIHPEDAEEAPASRRPAGEHR